MSEGFVAVEPTATPVSPLLWCRVWGDARDVPACPWVIPLDEDPDRVIIPPDPEVVEREVARSKFRRARKEVTYYTAFVAGKAVTGQLATTKKYTAGSGWPILLTPARVLEVVRQAGTLTVEIFPV